MKKEQQVFVLPKDTVTIGKMYFCGAEEDDQLAEIIIIKEKQIGLKWPVSPEIDLLLWRDAKDCTPTQRDRMDHHIERCVAEEYVTSLCKLIETDFHDPAEPIDAIASWQQGYAYRILPDVHKHCRIVMLEPPKEQVEVALRVIKGCLRYRRDQAKLREPLPTFEWEPLLQEYRKKA